MARFLGSIYPIFLFFLGILLTLGGMNERGGSSGSLAIAGAILLGSVLIASSIRERDGGK